MTELIEYTFDKFVQQKDFAWVDPILTWINLISTLNEIHPETIKFFIDWDEKINNVETCKDISTINLNMINKLKNNMFGNEGDKIY